MASRLIRRALCAVGAGALTVPLLAGVAAATPAHHQDGPTVVVSGLNNPRQLSLVDGLELLIAEAGKGGPTQISSPQGDEFVGATGSVSAVFLPQFAHDQQPQRIITGLMSGAGAPDGSFAVGSDGVSAQRLSGPIYVQETYAPPDVLPAPLGSTQDGKLLRARPFGPLSVVADISAYEAAHDPDGHGFDSDPYAVLALRDGQLVADAAGNDVLRVDARGRISVFHVFANVTTGPCADQYDPAPPFRGCNFVPTSLATDRHGNVYVGGLSSEVPGQAQVVELDPSGRHVLHTWGGFTSVTGVAVARDGSLYVSQLEAPEANPSNPQIVGVLTKIDRGGNRTNVDVPFPAGVVTDDRGNVYVSAFSVAPETGLAGPGTSGQVWRLRF